MINIAICDDSNSDLKLVGDIIEEILKSREIQYTLYKYTSADKLLEENKKINIVILDIAMPEMNGIELGRKIKEKNANVKLLYITSFQEYCERAINEVHAFSFLCKPIDKAKLERQIEEVVKREFAQRKIKIFFNLKDMLGNNYMTKKVNLEDIYYFEYIKSKRRILMVLENEKYEFAYVMDKLVKELEEHNFAINRRGELVNLAHVSKIKGYDVYLNNGIILSLSQKRATVFKEQLGSYISDKI